jgi:hypothetical protein
VSPNLKLLGLFVGLAFAGIVGFSQSTNASLIGSEITISETVLCCGVPVFGTDPFSTLDDTVPLQQLDVTVPNDPLTSFDLGSFEASFPDGESIALVLDGVSSPSIGGTFTNLDWGSTPGAISAITVNYDAADFDNTAVYFDFTADSVGVFFRRITSGPGSIANGAEVEILLEVTHVPLPPPAQKSLIMGPLVPDGLGGLEPIDGIGEGPFIAVGIRDQHWAFEITINETDDNGAPVYVDGIPSLYELSPFFEELETGAGCPDDGVCDGIREHADCPVTVTPPASRGRAGQTLIAIKPDLATDESCTTTVYVELSDGALRDIQSCTTAMYDNSEINYTFPFNDGVQGFDETTSELLSGPFDPIRLMPVGCP